MATQEEGAASFKDETDRRAAAVYEATPDLLDIRATHGWLRAWLGDPLSGIFFVAENPSLSRVAPSPANEDAENLQWAISPGDRVFRGALAAGGFKEGDPMATGGWRCYLTDVIKSPDMVSEWRARSSLDHKAAAEAWAPVLRYELEYGQPRLVVSVGKAADRLLDHLLRQRLIPPLPERAVVPHYAYIASRPDARRRDRGPMHPERVAEYNQEFVKLHGRLAGH